MNLFMRNASGTTLLYQLAGLVTSGSLPPNPADLLIPPSRKSMTVVLDARSRSTPASGGRRSVQDQSADAETAFMM